MMIRSFISVNVPGDHSASLADMHQWIGGHWHHKVRLTPSKQLHITLRFLGDRTEADLVRVEEQLLQVAEQLSPFRVTLRGVGAFPSPQRARILWLGVVEGSDSLVRMQKVLQQRLERIGLIESDPRPFHPHITFARVRIPTLDVRPLLERYSATTWYSVDVRALHLMRSDLTPEGAVYQSLVQGELCSRQDYQNMV